jgi:anti-sigma B factor antagonist
MIDSLSIEVTSVGFEAVLRLRGELDLSGIHRLAAAAAAALEVGHRRIVLDCALLSFVDAAGLGTIVGAAKRAEALGGELVLRNVDGEPLMVLTATDLGRRFVVEDCVGRRRVTATGVTTAA